MNHNQNPTTPAGRIHGWPHQEDTLRRFVQDHEQALTGAAIALAETAGWRLVDDIKEGLNQPGPLTRRIKLKLVRLMEILSLESVHDGGSEEAGCFALIDLTDPIVAEICLLTDGLREALATLAGDLIGEGTEWKTAPRGTSCPRGDDTSPNDAPVGARWMSGGPSMGTTITTTTTERTVAAMTAMTRLMNDHSRGLSDLVDILDDEAAIGAVCDLGANHSRIAPCPDLTRRSIEVVLTTLEGLSVSEANRIGGCWKTDIEGAVRWYGARLTDLHTRLTA